ncbi:uncharacterized protein [Oncorhynchus clarkii lewisi]|uniref:uncharacterized protein n=1 Tax=Oncorhynchus clarkii lewisi TaxID=490388 RepID=UPI0039B964FC
MFHSADKLTFGKAINLIVEPNGTPARPTLSILTPLHKIGNDDQPEVCLATGFFPRIENMNLTLGNNVTVPHKTTKAALSSTRTYFFAGFSKENIKRCEMDGVVKKRVDDGGFPDVSNYKTTATTASDNCEHERLNNATATNYTDYTKMNFTSLVVYGLRVLFAKAVAFNVLFTVKALVF